MSLDSEQSFACPYCGSENTITLDISGGRRQRFVYDCETCCAPIAIEARLDGEDVVSLTVRQEDND